MGRLMRTGVLGGTFDPPHIGHLILGEQARDQLKLDRVLWVPAGDPPHKQGKAITPARDRFEMVRLAIHDNTTFMLSDVDISRPGPHFTVDMLDLVAKQNPDDELYFLLGGDSLRDLPSWNEPHRLILNAFLVVMQRPDSHTDLTVLEDDIPGVSSRLNFVDTPLVAVSGSNIRQRVTNGNSIRYLVPPVVGDYILRNRLYLASLVE
jgi:nicotinate-nucleotide adenylyltransferase